MGRIFIIIALVSSSMVATTGFGVYYFSQLSTTEAKNEAFDGLVRGVSESISTRSTLLAETLKNIAESTELIAALQQSDIAAAKRIVQEKSLYLPGAMVFRLLLPGDTDPDSSIIPHLGYADLDLVSTTFQKPQAPLIQGEKGENRHLAITQGIIQDDKVVAVILASVSFKELQYSFSLLANDRVFVELKQVDFLLFSHGHMNIKESGIMTSAKIKNTAWEIVYWTDNNIDWVFANFVLSLILIPIFIAVLICYICFRHLAILLIKDQRSALSAAKDIMMGKSSGNYPISLKEMNSFIANIVQFKRVIDGTSKGSGFSDDELDLEGFQDQPEFLEVPDVIPQQGKGKKKRSSGEIGTAISLPEMTNIDQGKKSEFLSTSPANFSSESAVISTIFRAYDIRGIVDQSLTKGVVHDIGRAFGSEAFDKEISTIIVAKDGRTSGPSLSKALVDGILSTGVNIIDIGIVPTPVLYFVAEQHESHSAIMLTGSHNPAEYNGLKMVLAGVTLANERIQTLKTRIDASDFHANKVGTLTEDRMFTNEYIGAVTDDVRIARPMKVVLDAGNGVTGTLGPILLKTLGCEVVELFCEIDGTFPNHDPNPSDPENLSDLVSAVKHFNADVGLAFDGDGDRLVVVDSNGKIIWPDRQIMFFSQHILAKNAGAEIIYDVKCSRHVANQIEKNGGQGTVWKTGHSLMKAKIQETGAIFAGEMSGHLYFNDRWFGFDDGLYAAARLIEILSEDSRTSAEVFEDFPDSPNTPELSIQLTEGESVNMMKQIVANADFPNGKVTHIDGLRVDFDDGFGLIRSSNTTPSLVVRFEGDTEEALHRIQEEFRQLIFQVNSQLSLPF